VFCRAVLLKKCWLLLDRFGIELGFTCRFVDWKLSREGDTGFAPVITLAWWNVPGSILDCCIDTRPWPNWLLYMELIPLRTRSLVAA
jgi:hypothetical protein